MTNFKTTRKKISFPPTFKIANFHQLIDQVSVTIMRACPGALGKCKQTTKYVIHITGVNLSYIYNTYIA